MILIRLKDFFYTAQTEALGGEVYRDDLIDRKVALVCRIDIWDFD